MIKVGKILIDYDSLATVTRAYSQDVPRGVSIIQIVYKNGVVKNFRTDEVGMNFDMFVDKLEKIRQQEEDKKLLKLSVMFNQNK